MTHSPSLQLRGVEFQILEANDVAAQLQLEVSIQNAGGADAKVGLRAEVFEVGWDGRPSASSLAMDLISDAVAGAEQCLVTQLMVRIGTPFFWTETTPFRYLVRVTLDLNGSAGDCGERVFSFTRQGQVLAPAAFQPGVPPVADRDPRLPAIYVVGDSTAFSNGFNQLGWGDALGKFFDPRQITVCNRARPGRSTRSFRNEGLWRRVLAELQPGDVVLLQFGHNDADTPDERRCRGVLPGTGSETQAVIMPDGTREVVHTYGWYLREFIAETLARAATPILLSLTIKNQWLGGRLQRDQSDYGRWAGQVARGAGVGFIDLNRRIADRYEALGEALVQPLFSQPADNVHTSPAGAELNAACVVAGMQALNPEKFNPLLL